MMCLSLLWFEYRLNIVPQAPSTACDTTWGGCGRFSEVGLSWIGRNKPLGVDP